MIVADASDFWFEVFDDVLVNHLRLVHNKIKWFLANKKVSAVDRKEYFEVVQCREKDSQGLQIPNSGMQIQELPI